MKSMSHMKEGCNSASSFINLICIYNLQFDKGHTKRAKMN